MDIEKQIKSGDSQMKKNIIFGLIVVSFVLAGCKQEAKDTKEASTEVLKELSGGQEAVTETPAQNMQSLRQRVIEDQTFEIQLDDWGMVTFTSVAPEDNSNKPEFLLTKNDKIIYEFPEITAAILDSFGQVSGVKFSDMNMDGKKDILLLLQYSNDGNSWNMPVIFLQENQDNMMYLDYPNLESYKVEAKTKNGNPFYRDTFLEKFLSKQHLTEKLSDMEDVWTDYVKYVDSISGAAKDIQKQIEVFAQNRDKWATDIDFANEQYKFTLADLDMDGQVELLVSHCGGTGFFSYTSFYKVDKDGKLKELNTTFSEYESQPDLMDPVSDESDVTVYSNIIDGKGCYNYIVYDFMKESPDCYIYWVSSLTIVDDVVTETKLAIEYEIYEGPDYEGTISYEDYNGEELTEDEYRTYAARYYEAQQASEHQAHFRWKDVSDIVNVSDAEAVQILMESYDAYSFH